MKHEQDCPQAAFRGMLPALMRALRARGLQATSFIRLSHVVRSPILMQSVSAEFFRIHFHFSSFPLLSNAYIEQHLVVFGRARTMRSPADRWRCDKLLPRVPPTRPSHTPSHQSAAVSTRTLSIRRDRYVIFRLAKSGAVMLSHCRR